MIVIEVQGKVYKGKTASGNEYQAFEANYNDQKCKFTLWSAEPTLRQGDSIRCAVTSKGDYKGKPSYWLDTKNTPIEVNGKDQEIVQKSALPSRQQAEVHVGPPKMDIDEAIMFCVAKFELALSLVASKAREVGVEASPDTIFENARALVQTPLINLFNGVYVTLPPATKITQEPPVAQGEPCISKEWADQIRARIRKAPDSKEIIEAVQKVLASYKVKGLEELTETQAHALEDFLFGGISDDQVPF